MDLHLVAIVLTNLALLLTLAWVFPELSNFFPDSRSARKLAVQILIVIALSAAALYLTAEHSSVRVQLLRFSGLFLTLFLGLGTMRRLN